MVIIAVAGAIAAVITLLGLLCAKDGYEDETGFHAGNPKPETRVVGIAVVVQPTSEPARAAAETLPVPSAGPAYAAVGEQLCAQ